MTDKLISIDEKLGDHADDLKKLMKLVDPSQHGDRDLTRLLLIRLQLDGLERTRAYLVKKTRAAEACNFTGRLYDYLKDDLEEGTCQNQNP